MFSIYKQGESIIGQKGEKGEPGLVITKFEGETHNFGELQIREICGNIIRGLHTQKSDT